MPDSKTKGILNDIGTEELAHFEMIGAMIYQLTNGVSVQELEDAGLGTNYIENGYGISIDNSLFSSMNGSIKGDPIADLQANLAMEQRSRATYEKLIDLCADEPDVIEPLKFLRQREIVHFQRFGEALRGIQEKLAEKKVYINYDEKRM